MRIIAHADGIAGVGFRGYTDDCLCLFFCVISQKPMQLGSPNLRRKTVAAWVFALLFVLASSGFPIFQSDRDVLTAYR